MSVTNQRFDIDILSMSFGYSYSWSSIAEEQDMPIFLIINTRGYKEWFKTKMILIEKMNFSSIDIDSMFKKIEKINLIDLNFMFIFSVFTFVLWGLSLFLVNNIKSISLNYRLRSKAIRNVSLFFSFILILICVFASLKLDASYVTASSEVFSFFHFIKWSSFFNFFYFISVDNISFVFIFLTFFLLFICILISWNSIKYKYNSFIICIFTMSFLLLNVFSTLDLFFFYIFFESLLIPLFILIGVWGSRQRKVHAAYQLFFYTLIGSLFMLLGILMIYSQHHTTDIMTLYGSYFSFQRQIVLWLAFFIAFSVKIPIFPFHIWLPEAHVEAPTVGSVFLAGILLKVGSYGMYRFMIPLFPDANYFFLPLVFSMSIIGIFYTCCSTIRQIDLKKIIAYASVSHMGFVILGLFSPDAGSVSGSLFLMLSHGIVSSGLFFCVGCLYDRYRTRIISYYGGLATFMPLYAICLFILILSNMSFPGTIGFIGELVILLNLIKVSKFCSLLATFSVILTAIYSIWLYNRLVLKKPQYQFIHNFSDMSKKEFFIGYTFVFITLYIGFNPAFLLLYINNSAWHHTFYTITTDTL